jgi:putative SOS response-associated peptidase YedK
MCGRYSITLPPEAIRELFQTYGELPNWPAYYNAAPTTALPVVRQAKDGDSRELVLMTWGLIPWFSKDGKTTYSTINARAEGIQTAASYREPFKTRRCIVPASGYFEWTGPKNDRQPHYFRRADGQPMALAGLWDRWRSKDKSETKESFTIVTTEPSKFAARFHNRMPLILEPDTWDRWIKSEPDVAATLMKPASEDVLIERIVSKAVGNVKNNGPELLSAL